MNPRYWFLIVIILLSGRTLAQDTPLVGPLLAVSSADQESILLYDLGTDQVRQLALGAGWHQVWGFTPDGCRLLFTLADGTRPGRLYSARLDGSDQQPLVRYDALPPDAWGVWEPQMSPDGSRIAFVLVRDQEGGRQYHIAVMPAAGGEPTVYSQTGFEFEPRWSPDGAQLAYISFSEQTTGADLWVMSADGATRYPVALFDEGSVTKPRWSPDGELIGFVYSPSGSNDTFWMVGAQQGALPTQLSYQYALALDLTWLPDSTQMLAAVRDFQGVSENRLWGIPLVGNADNSAQPYLAHLPLSHADYPRFSPDGLYLAVRSAYELALVDLRDGSMRLLDQALLGNVPTVWSPPGFIGEAACAAQS